jgi:5-methylthioribose kinase
LALIPTPSLTLTPDTALSYLAGRGYNKATTSITELSGGVSNTVLLVEHEKQRFVLKQALPQLRVQQEWFSDLRRIFTESAGLRTVSALLPPNSVPEVLFEDRANFLFAMTAADPAATTWKSQLLKNEANPSIAAQVARILGTMIRKSWESPELREAFSDITIFDQLRLDPYFGQLTRLYPELRPHMETLIEKCRTRKASLVHGDWSPKNILVHDGHALAIDFEVLHFGDPSFDAAFLLNHLLLKTFIGLAGAPALARIFWQTLQSEIPQTPWFEPSTIAHLGALLLARIDGKSPAEYIQRDDLKQQIREFARNLILHPPATVSEVWESYAAHH